MKLLRQFYLAAELLDGGQKGKIALKYLENARDEK